MCSDGCDQKPFCQAAMFYFYTDMVSSNSHANQKSLMSYFFYMWEFC